jgi:hypothetical protein
VLDGLLVRRVGVGGRFGAELLAAGDLLRPWQHDGAAEVLPFEMAWRIVAAVRLAVLDTRWAARMAPYPDVAGELTGRALDRSRRLATLMAISQQPRLDRRVWLLFWECGCCSGSSPTATGRSIPTVSTSGCGSRTRSSATWWRRAGRRSPRR